MFLVSCLVICLAWYLSTSYVSACAYGHKGGDKSVIPDPSTVPPERREHHYMDVSRHCWGSYTSTLPAVFTSLSSKFSTCLKQVISEANTGAGMVPPSIYQE